MADSLDTLVTRVKKDRGYSPDPPTGMNGFVCPRANAYGGRDGIIPPGIAAQRGLVPVRMHEVTIAGAADSAAKARNDGKTEAERYREYYEEQARRKAQEERQESQEPAKAVVAGIDYASKPSETVKVEAQVDDAGNITPTKIERRQDPVVTSKELKATDFVQKPNSGMFSEPSTGERDQETLDGFYDSLPSHTGGTSTVKVGRDEAFRRQLREETARTASPTNSVPAVVARPSPFPPTREVPNAELILSLRDDIRRIGKEKATLEQAMAAMESECQQLRDRLTEANSRQDPKPEHHETVRVVLGGEDERLKVGGDGWECKVMGHLAYSRTRGGAVLIIGDMSYASELLAEIRPGRMAIVSANGRTDCVYSGICDKIYGESGSPDFIACFRVTCDEESNGA